MKSKHIFLIFFSGPKIPGCMWSSLPAGLRWGTSGGSFGDVSELWEQGETILCLHLGWEKKTNQIPVCMSGKSVVVKECANSRGILWWWGLGSSQDFRDLQSLDWFWCWCLSRWSALNIRALHAFFCTEKDKGLWEKRGILTLFLRLQRKSLNS